MKISDLKRKNKNEGRLFRSEKPAGFTIVETMFVLAIAGIILLLVFEAIPALSRSSRNNNRKQDVATILAAISQYELNNGGTFPSNCGSLFQPLCGASTSEPLYYVNHDSSLSYYEDTVVNNVVITAQSRSFPPIAVNIPPVSGSNALNEVEIYNYEKCDPNTPGGAVIAGAGYNDIVALYALEAGNGGRTTECEQL